TIPKFIFPGSYEHLTVNSNNGTISCTKFDEDYNDGIKTLSCAMIIIKEQDYYEVLKGIKRIIELNGEFSEIDLRTDGLQVTFLGNNHITTTNQITFRPAVGSQPNDSLFRVTNGGELNLDSIQVTRIRSFIGAEEIPIVSVVPESGKYGQISSIPGILTLTNSIISGSGSFSEKWSGKQINEICNLNYAPLIASQSTGKVTLIGTTITQSEGTGIYVSGGAQLSIDSTSQLSSNGERIGSLLSGMQTHVVCNGIDASGYPITTSVDINFNSLPSYSTNQETWVFADSSKGCNSIIRSPGINIYGRIVPQVSTGILQINIDESGSRTVKAIVTGNNLNPCDRFLTLEVLDERGTIIAQQNLNETTSLTNSQIKSASNAPGAQWEDIDKFSLQLSSFQFLNTTTQSKYNMRVVELGKGSQSASVGATVQIVGLIPPPEEEPGVVETKSTGLSIYWIVGLAVGIPLVLFIIAVFVILCFMCYLRRKQQNKNQDHDMDQRIEVKDSVIFKQQKGIKQKSNNKEEKVSDYQIDVVEESEARQEIEQRSLNAFYQAESQNDRLNSGNKQNFQDGQQQQSDQQSSFSQSLSSVQAQQQQQKIVPHLITQNISQDNNEEDMHQDSRRGNMKQKQQDLEQNQNKDKQLRFNQSKGSDNISENSTDISSQQSRLNDSISRYSSESKNESEVIKHEAEKEKEKVKDKSIKKSNNKVHSNKTQNYEQEKETEPYREVEDSTSNDQKENNKKKNKKKKDVKDDDS
ncbi:MAG: hypothetical protein EZS28_035482, partial [Streblomastix strix]